MGQPPPLSRELSFLHLTDAHFSDNVFSQASWRSFIKFVSAQLPKIDFVFFTGDISDRNSEHGYNFAVEFIKQLCAVLPGASSVYSVPGNHDLTRNKARLIACSAKTLLESLLNRESREMLEAPFSRYCNAIRAAGAHGHDLNEKIVSAHRSDVRVLSLNTSWLSRHTEKDHGKLSFCVDLWEAILGVEPSPKAPLTIVLMHHGPEWLDPDEHRRAERFLCRHADIVLCGHQHDEAIKRLEVDGYSCVLLTGANIGGQEGYPYHRAIWGTIATDGTMRFHRIVRDPSRPGTDDEWSLMRSLIEQSLITRVEERAMRAVLVHKNEHRLDALRTHWQHKFEKDTLVGFTESDPRDLIVIYRKLTMAKLYTDDSDFGDTSLWMRLQQILEVMSLGEITAQCNSLFKQMTPANIQSTAAMEDKHVQLSGDLRHDLKKVVSYIVIDTVKKVVKPNIPLRRYGDYTDAQSEEFILTIAHFPSLLRDGVRLSNEYPLSDRAGAMSILWLPILIGEVIPYLSERYRSDPEVLSILINLRSEAHSRLRTLAPDFRPSMFLDYLILLDRDLAYSRIGQIMSGDVIRRLSIEPETGLDRRIMKLKYARRKADAEETMQLVVSALKDLMDSLNESQLNILHDALNPDDLLNNTIKSVVAQEKDLPIYTAQILCSILQNSSENRLASSAFKIATSVALEIGRISRESLMSNWAALLPHRFVQVISDLNPYFQAWAILRRTQIDVAQVRLEAKRLIDDSFRAVLIEALDSPSLSLEEVRAGDVEGSPSVIAILGNPGTGKTTLLRHLCLTCAESDVPVFVPLKLWNSKTSLQSCIDDVLTDAGFSTDALKKLVFSGDAHSSFQLLLLLDGLDEIHELSLEKRIEIESVVESWRGGGQVIITSRISAAEYLPRQTSRHRYSLNRLSHNDVLDFFHAWYGDDVARGRNAVERAIIDARLMEELRTPFILRMYCAMMTAGEDSRIWALRTTMYESIANYLLDRRDRDRGIPLAFNLAVKKQLLARVARHAMEESAALIGAQTIIEIARQVLGGSTREEAIALIKEIVNRSNILVRMSSSSYDFGHFILREFFAVAGWDEDGAWRRWDAASAKSYLVHESVARFLVGYHHDERHFIVDRVRDALLGNPVLELLVANIRLEAFDRCEIGEQIAYLGDFVDAATRSVEMDLDEVGAVASQMFERCANRADAQQFFVSRLSNIVGQHAVVETRLLGIVGIIRDRVVAHAVARVSERVPTLRGTVWMILARMGPGVAGGIVRALIQSTDAVDLLRTCLLRTEEWTRFLRPDVQKIFNSIGQMVPSSDLFVMHGIRGTEDGLAVLRVAATALFRFLFNATGDFKSDISNDSLGRILERCDGNSISQLKTAIIQRVGQRPVRPVQLVRYPEVVKAIAAELDLQLTVRNISAVSPPEVVAHQQFQHIVRALADAADASAIEIIVEWLGQSELLPEIGELLTTTVEELLRRFIKSLPRDIIELCGQIVDDLWVGSHSNNGADDALIQAKQERSEYVRHELGIPDVHWAAAREVVEKLPRRPTQGDWAFLQHRFGGLVRVLQRVRDRVHTGVFYNIISEESWCSLYKAQMARG